MLRTMLSPPFSRCVISDYYNCADTKICWSASQIKRKTLRTQKPGWTDGYDNEMIKSTVCTMNFYVLSFLLSKLNHFGCLCSSVLAFRKLWWHADYRCLNESPECLQSSATCRASVCKGWFILNCWHFSHLHKVPAKFIEIEIHRNSLKSHCKSHSKSQWVNKIS